MVPLRVPLKGHYKGSCKGSPGSVRGIISILLGLNTHSARIILHVASGVPSKQGLKIFEGSLKDSFTGSAMVP